jgi:hypothetical protein
MTLRYLSLLMGNTLLCWSSSIRYASQAWVLSPLSLFSISKCHHLLALMVTVVPVLTRWSKDPPEETTVCGSAPSFRSRSTEKQKRRMELEQNSSTPKPKCQHFINTENTSGHGSRGAPPAIGSDSMPVGLVALLVISKPIPGVAM